MLGRVGSMVLLETWLLIACFGAGCMVHVVRMCTGRFTQPIGLTYLFALGSAIGRALDEEGLAHHDVGTALGSVASSTWFGMVVLSKPTMQTQRWDRSMVVGLIIGVHSAVLVACMEADIVASLIISTLTITTLASALSRKTDRRLQIAAGFAVLGSHAALLSDGAAVNWAEVVSAGGFLVATMQASLRFRRNDPSAFVSEAEHTMTTMPIASI